MQSSSMWISTPRKTLRTSRSAGPRRLSQPTAATRAARPSVLSALPTRRFDGTAKPTCASTSSGFVPAWTRTAPCSFFQGANFPIASIAACSHVELATGPVVVRRYPDFLAGERSPIRSACSWRIPRPKSSQRCRAIAAFRRPIRPRPPRPAGHLSTRSTDRAARSSPPRRTRR